MTIEQIVEEVLRRLEALKNRKNLLVVTGPDLNVDLLKEFLSSMDRKNLKVGTIAIESADDLTKVLDELVIEHFAEAEDDLGGLNQYDAILVGGLSVGTLYNISVLNINGRLEKLIWKLLTSDKKVYGLKDISLKKKNLKAKLESLYGSLADMGIQWYGTKGNETVSSSIVSKKVISVQDLSGLKSCSVIIGKDAVVTPLAKDFAVKNKLALVRK